MGAKHGDNRKAINRKRETCDRMVGLPGDAPLRTDANGYPVNRAFADVVQDSQRSTPSPASRRISAFNLFAYLSRSDVTWNPSVTSVCKTSLYCPTTEEFILPIKHGNDRVEWFIQLSDEIMWEVEDKETGRPRAKVIMKAGDIAAMPADIRHQGFSAKRSMLLVWENANPDIARMHAEGRFAAVSGRVLIAASGAAHHAASAERRSGSLPCEAARRAAPGRRATRRALEEEPYFHEAANQTLHRRRIRRRPRRRNGRDAQPA